MIRGSAGYAVAAADTQGRLGLTDALDLNLRSAAAGVGIEDSGFEGRRPAVEDEDMHRQRSVGCG